MYRARRWTLLAALALVACAPGQDETDETPVLRLRSPLLAPAGVPVTFDASATSDDHGIVLYRVQFGDGGPEQDLSGPIFTHTYAIPATYQVELLALDAAGHRDQLRRGFTVVERYWPPYCDEALPCEHGARCDEGECFVEGEGDAP